MKQNQKGFAHIPIIIALALGLIIAGYFVFRGDTNNIVNELNNESENEFEGWETYVNTQYGFEIKHPSDWQVKDQGFVLIYKDKDGSLIDRPLSIFNNYEANIIAFNPFYPGSAKDWAADSPIYGAAQTKNVDIKLSPAINLSIELSLHENNQVKGYIGNFTKSPFGSEDMFFATTKVNDRKIECIPVDPPHPDKPEGECNEFWGDTFYTSGETNPSDLQTIKQILSTFQFTN